MWPAAKAVLVAASPVAMVKAAPTVPMLYSFMNTFMFEKYLGSLLSTL